MKTILKIWIYILFITISKSIIAQDLESGPSLANVFKLNFLLPGVSYEQKIGKFHTLDFGIYWSAVFSEKYETSDGQRHMISAPTFNAEFRKYYNLEKRAVYGKLSALNSANYFAPIYRCRFSRTEFYSPRILVNQIGGVWGIQRNYPKRFSLDINGGLVYTFDYKDYNYYDPLELVLQLKLGIWLGKKSQY